MSTVDDIYERHYSEVKMNTKVGTFPKQERYRDNDGKEDYLDEFFRTATPEEVRGAMKFTVGKYNRRMGKKDDEISEVTKMEDYCHRWRLYLESRANKDEL